MEENPAYKLAVRIHRGVYEAVAVCLTHCKHVLNSAWISWNIPLGRCHSLHFTKKALSLACIAGAWIVPILIQGSLTKPSAFLLYLNGPFAFLRIMNAIMSIPESICLGLFLTLYKDFQIYFGI